MTKVSKVSVVESNVNVNAIEGAVQMEVKQVKGYSIEGNIVSVKGYKFNTETNELVRKGKTVLNVMPRFHEEVLAAAEELKLDSLKALCVVVERTKMTAEEKKANKAERKATKLASMTIEEIATMKAKQADRRKIRIAALSEEQLVERKAASKVRRDARRELVKQALAAFVAK